MSAVDAPADGREEQLAGTVERVVFRNDETGYAVMRVAVNGWREPVTVVGTIPAASPGDVLRAQGSWQNDKTWGRQFRASSLMSLPPTTAEGVENFLAAGRIKGVGAGLAHRLAAHFGKELITVLDRDAARLGEVEGIGPRTAERIGEAWREHRESRDALMFLHGHGLGAQTAAKIMTAYGRDVVTRVSADPYALADDIRGIGFQKADTIAQRLGIATDSPQRLRAALEHALGEAIGDGHTALPRDTAIEQAAMLTGNSLDLVDRAADVAVAEGRLVATEMDGRIYLQLPDLAFFEHDSARMLRERAELAVGWGALDVERAQSALAHDLAPSQIAALQVMHGARVGVITGGPGTGKTTLVRAVLAALPELVVPVVLAAPTGRAAKRLAESTGREASTLHRLLEAEPGRGFRRNREHPLEAALLVVDEVSMVDLPLLHALLTALPAAAALLFVGDVDQLPSVGPGRVLADIIDSGRVPVVRLTEIFRQSEASRIVLNAHRVNQGQLPLFARNDDAPSDFYGIRAETPADAASKLVDLVTNRIPQRFGLDPWTEIQVLCPTNRGPLGTRELNDRLRAALNPTPSGRIERKGTVYATGDRIMQVENDYEREVYNGDIGRITRVDERTGTVEITMDGRELTYAQDELDQLAPAYAITVHKAQGSEYPAVVMPLTRQHGRMLRRDLLYTGLTRARRLVVLVTENEALERAVGARNQGQRWSLLRHHLVTEKVTTDVPG